MLPNTYQVKVAGGTSIIGGLGYALIFLTSYFLIAHVFIAAAFTKRILRESDSAQLLLATLIGVWSAYVVWVGGDFMEFRFFVPILPLAFVLLVWVLVTMIEQQPVRLAAIALVFAGSVYHWKYYETKRDIGSIWELRRYMETPAEDWPGVGRALFELFGRDADGVTIAVLPAGAVPYYSKLKTIDMLGLNDPWVARHGIEIGSLPGHSLLAPLQYLVDSGAHLVVSDPRVEPKNAPRVPYDIDEVARFLIQPVSADELPDDARFVEFSVNDSHRITVLYLMEHPAVERAIQNGNLSVFPVLR